MNYLNEDGFGSRIADNIINDSYYSDLIEEEHEHETTRLTKDEESVIVNRLIEPMTGKKRSKRNAKV